MANIKNFVLVWFKRRWRSDQEVRRHQFAERFNELMQFQIRSFYPRAAIHILTNDESVCRRERNVIYHLRKDMIPNLFSKLHIFGLLDEPAMFLDGDILLRKPFED